MKLYLKNIYLALNIRLLQPTIIRFIIISIGIIVSMLFNDNNIVYMEDNLNKETNHTFGEKYLWWLNTQNVITIIVVVGSAIFIYKMDEYYAEQLNSQENFYNNKIQEVYQEGLSVGYQEGYSDGSKIPISPYMQEQTTIAFNLKESLQKHIDLALHEITEEISSDQDLYSVFEDIAFEDTFITFLQSCF